MATNPQTQPAAKKAYRVLTPVEHDHERHEIGATIRLDEKTAKQLLDVQAIEPAGKDAE